MADSVDTMIENAYNRAATYGLFADDNAYKAVHGVDPFPGAFAKTSTPKKYSKKLELPALPTEAELQAFRQGLQNLLDDFFGEYFSPSDAYLAAEAWVIDTLTTGDPKLPGNNFDVIWARAVNHTEALGNSVDDLELPEDAYEPHTALAYAAFDPAKTYSRSVVKVDLWNHAAASHLRDLRAEAITATGEYIRAIARADLIPVNAQTAIMQAHIAMRTAMADWFLAQLGPTQRDVDRKIVSVGEDRSGEIVSDDAVMKKAELLVKAAISGAEAVSMVAQAAAASMNSVIGSSTVGFQ